MEHPVCPPGWNCTFKQPAEHFVGPWYEGTWGIVMAGVAIVAIVAILCTIAYYIHATRVAKLDAAEKKRKEQHELAMEEQRTIQADAAKGNPEMLKLIREGNNR